MPNSWDEKLKKYNSVAGAFLQSEEWAGFRRACGTKVWQIEGEKAMGLIFKSTRQMPLSLNFLYCAKGPVGDANDKKFWEEVKKIARAEHSIFFRFEPQEKPTIKDAAKTKDIQPEITQILELQKNEDEILASMHQKTRYNIRLAEKKGVEIKMFSQSESKKEIDTFFSLLQGTEQRKNIRLWPKDYYEKLLDLPSNKLFIAYSEGKPLAGAMVNFFNKTATYLHGGTAKENMNAMAPYLLHWEIIKYAKVQGFKYYDWWGINPEPGHRWAGITRFKQGFGGYELRSPGTYDLPLKKFWYWIYKMLRK